MKTLFIVNPRAANGRTGQKWRQIHPALKAIFDNRFDVQFTARPMHASELAREGIHKGYQKIIAVGGDGTINEVVNGFFENGTLVSENVALGVLEMGTGGDLVRTLRMPERWQEALQLLKEANPSPVDVGVAEFVSVLGDQTRRYFINIMDFGIGGAVVERVNRTTKMFGGRISFLWAILITLLRYSNKTIRYRLDDAPEQTGVFNNFIIANGRYFGGGLNPAPQALLDDGQFDVVFFGDVGRLEAVRNLSRLRKGTHLENPKVSVTRARTVEATSDEAVYIDMDGEFVGQLPARVHILPAALSVLK